MFNFRSKSLTASPLTQASYLRVLRNSIMQNFALGYVQDSVFHAEFRTTAVDHAGVEMAVAYCTARNGFTPHQWCLKPIAAGEYTDAEHLTTDDLSVELDYVFNNPHEFDEFVLV